MNQFVTEQLIYVLRLVAAALCGGLIGCERQSKKKTAGTRTHVIIAVASAMMMIISKYGFGDVLNEYVKLDLPVWLREWLRPLALLVQASLFSGTTA